MKLTMREPVLLLRFERLEDFYFWQVEFFLSVQVKSCIEDWLKCVTDAVAKQIYKADL